MIEKIVAALRAITELKITLETPERIVNAADLPLLYILPRAREPQTINFEGGYQVQEEYELVLLVSPITKIREVEAFKLRSVIEEKIIVALLSLNEPSIKVFITAEHDVREVGGIVYLASVFKVVLKEVV